MRNTRRRIVLRQLSSLVVAVVISSSLIGSHSVAGTAQEQQKLTGIGAAKKVWKKNHKIDKSPKLQRGCCYLPRVRVEGKLRDTWVAVVFGDPPKRRVLLYTRNFPDGTDEVTARALLASDDLPIDAAVAWEKEDGPCKIIQFSSPLFASAVDDQGLGPQVALISGYEEEESYASTHVLEAILLWGEVADQDVFC